MEGREDSGSGKYFSRSTRKSMAKTSNQYRLLVIGESGVGKTTLIQSLFDLKKNRKYSTIPSG